MGVHISLGGEYAGIQQGAGTSSGAPWSARVRGDDGQETLWPFDVLAGADGANSAVARTPGIDVQLGRVQLGLRRNSAIGLVANFFGNPPQGLRQFSWARQFAEEKFAELERTAGISLENCVYYRSGAQHYLVMTPTRESLTSRGVFLQHDAEELTAGRNVNREAVREVAKCAAAHFGLPSMEFAEAPHDAMLFDFSGTSRAQGSCAFL